MKREIKPPAPKIVAQALRNMPNSAMTSVVTLMERPWLSMLVSDEHQSCGSQAE